ncbi:recombination regulator RecX [Streptomyces sp. NBC_00452]|uniref:recombination regulator RecX n=1 Tax=Streptomyces sp. NBC_00452 TaxID=2975746 RepID=UPI00225701EA|nr:recombination regulator RecX [Streptomyces sp. NBC_00452]MCX5061812.1 recombination regulator RecX [Streptomyces sp. NBC_00452]
MTRRTDWAEYAHLDAPRERRRGGDGGYDRPGDEAYAYDPAHGTDGGRGRVESYSSEASYSGASHGDEPGGGEWPDDDGSAYGSDAYGSDSFGSDASGGGSRRRGGGSRGGAGARGAGGSRGRRQRRRGEPSGEDGGSSSSSRAEQEESSGDPVERARAICLRLLTGTPRTRKQLADALRKREIPDDAADEVLSRFEEVGLINDSAFADAWVESRHHGRGLARRALAQELRTKGVDSTLIDEAVSQLDSEQEETTARELVARKLRSTRGLDRDKRLRRLAGMLARKGYPEGMALRVVRQALEEEGEDTEFLGDEGF